MKIANVNPGHLQSQSSEETEDFDVEIDDQDLDEEPSKDDDYDLNYSSPNNKKKRQRTSPEQLDVLEQYLHYCGPSNRIISPSDDMILANLHL
jgi:hypothetical protein